MIVVKFGGTSVGTPAQIAEAARIVQSMRDRRPIVVVSAMAGVTDALLKAGDAAVAAQSRVREDVLWEIRSRHHQALSQLFSGAGGAAAVEDAERAVWEEAQKVFTGVSLLREMSARSRDLISSFGERLMAPLFAQRLNEIGVGAAAVDARDIIVTADDADFLRIDFDETRRRCGRLMEMAQSGVTPVVTGFICSTPAGVTTTLGRGGSDYSASIIGACIKVDEIQIWTDVDGVMTADPRIVPGARVLDRVSYREAAEMSYFGAKVLHPRTITPAADENIPIRIKNTFAPDARGTLITSDTPERPYSVKTVASITGMALVFVEGGGMSGAPGLAGRLFGTIARRRINVLMFSQGSSEQHISLVVHRNDREETVKALRGEFQGEIGRRQIDRIDCISEMAIIALVGKGIKGAPGVAANAFAALGANAIDILMIAQGSSELSLSFVTEERDAARAVALLHAAFELDKALL